MHERHCPRCGSLMASAEYLGVLAEGLAGATTTRLLLDAVRGADDHDVRQLMSRVEQQSPGLAAALRCYVGTCHRAGT